RFTPPTLSYRAGAGKWSPNGDLSRSGPDTASDVVGVEGTVGATQVGVLVREDAGGAVPARHHPCVHHPGRDGHVEAALGLALVSRDVGVDRADDFGPLHADAAVAMPVVVRSGEAFG